MEVKRRRFTCTKCQRLNVGIQDRCLVCGTPAPGASASATGNEGTTGVNPKPQKFCAKCGQLLKPGVRFCSKCGAKVKVK